MSVQIMGVAYGGFKKGSATPIPRTARESALKTLRAKTSTRGSGWSAPPPVYDVVRDGDNPLEGPLKQLIEGGASSALDARTPPPSRQQPARVANELSVMTQRVGDCLSKQLSDAPGFFKAWVCARVARKLFQLDNDAVGVAFDSQLSEQFLDECRFGVHRGDSSISPACAEFVRFDGSLLTASGRAAGGSLPLLLVHPRRRTAACPHVHLVEALGGKFTCFDLGDSLVTADGVAHSSQYVLLTLSVLDLVHDGFTPLTESESALTDDVVKSRGTTLITAFLSQLSQESSRGRARATQAAHICVRSGVPRRRKRRRQLQ